MERYVCIHGHFYQPPRENPWLEEIELQDSAFPYRDWNERITSECYAPNTASRILDENNDIVDIVNNYARISFDFGPTLLTWMERIQPEVYQMILDADKMSQDLFTGHGAAMAQAYNHMIMPLANERDKRTQVIWGIRDFEARFKRKPEAMWLPETAVDLATLEILVDQGIYFTVLAPHQMKSFRKIGEKAWHRADDANRDLQRPYVVKLPSGKSIVVFFYDGPISRDIAFGGLLNSGEGLARRLTEAFPSAATEDRLVHVATDGETYGHHHRFGNMALSYCLYYLRVRKLAKTTNYGEYLEKHPPEYEAEIYENSSWSCAHGVERWRSDCGCHIGGHPGWNQKWRVSLRGAMDWLRDKLAAAYEREMKVFFKDPWLVRDEYIRVLLDRSRDNVMSFLNKHAFVDLTPDSQIRILKLLEMQRHAMFMYTSCGWFFDDISGIESVQILQYAARAIQLGQEIVGGDFETPFLKMLESATSNFPEKKNGAEIYRQHVKPDIIGLLDVGAHYAMASLFEHYPEKVKVYAYTVTNLEYHVHQAGKQNMVIGKAAVRSDITWEENIIDFAVLHLGDYNVYGGVRFASAENGFDGMHHEISDVFMQNNIPLVIQLMNRHFGTHNYSLWNLFKNEQGRVLEQVFNNTLGSIEAHFREIYEHYYPLMQIKPDFRMSLPKALSMTVEFILNRDMVEALEAKVLDVEKLRKVAAEIKRWSFMRDKENLSFVASRRIDELMQEFVQHPQNVSPMKNLCELLELLRPLALPLDLWKTQNVYFAMAKDTYGPMRQHAERNDKHAQEWVTLFNQLGKYLKVKNI